MQKCLRAHRTIDAAIGLTYLLPVSQDTHVFVEPSEQRHKTVGGPEAANRFQTVFLSFGSTSYLIESGA
jgi:hypothetical protein